VKRYTARPPRSDPLPHFGMNMADGAKNVIDTLRERGFVAQITDEPGLRAHLTAGPVTYYAGFDPTAPSLHVGHVVPLMAMAHLARAGHRPIVLLGGGTTMVGDPSGRSELRQMLTPEAIDANRRNIEPQARRVVGEGAQVLDNAEWLLPLKYVDFLREIGRHFSVNRMLAAEAYRSRLEKGLSFIEFNYQLLQAYDFLVLNQRHGCTLQMGGDDQWGNILAGADLIRRVQQKDAYALTFPLLMTATGAKMGKTASGAIWLSAEQTSVFDFYQYFVNVDDRDVVRFLKLLTFLPMAEIESLAALEGAALRTAKQTLAFEVTRNIHGQEAAEAAQGAARAAFGGGGVTEGGAAGGGEVPTHKVSRAELAGGAKIVDLLAASGLAASKSAARRLIAQGGVRLGEGKVTDVEAVLKESDLGEAGTATLHAGKKHLRRIVVE
jgi:tyrosyl-tRNA synthetase